MPEEKPLMICDERFARDKERIKECEQRAAAHDAGIIELQKLSVQMGEILKRHDDKIGEHETRIDTLEHKPTVWLDKIISAVIAAGISVAFAIIFK